MNWLKNLSNRGATKSGSTAKNRLQLVLVQDRINLPVEEIDQLKLDLIAAISKYVEIDKDGVDVTLTNQGRRSRVTARAPIIAILQNQQ